MKSENQDDAADVVGACLALAFPDRVARRRGADGAEWASVGGRGFRLDPMSSLAQAEWLAVGEVQGVAAGARILSAAAIDRETVEALFGERIETRRTVTFDPATGGVAALRERRLGAIRLTSGPDEMRDPAAVAAALLKGVRTHGLALLPWNDGARALQARVAHARAAGGKGAADLPALDDAALLAGLDDWLPPLLAGRRRLDALADTAVEQALSGMLGWAGTQVLDGLAPATFRSPAGSSHAIDYGADGGPAVTLRVQALYGLAAHPVAGGTPLVLRLTSPAGRPIQTTRDLPGFWAGSWTAVAREMRGRYPRHPWPEDPAAADPTLRTKRADARNTGQ